VHLKLALSSVEEFFGLAPDVLRSIENTTSLRLVAAGQSPTRTELFHVWQLASPADLRESMIRLADNPAYGRLDRLILDEHQDIVTPLGRVPDVRPTARGSERYVQVSGHLRTKDLAEFQAQNEVPSPVLAKRGWRLWGCFLNITGRLDTVTSIWTVPGERVIRGNEFRDVPGVVLLEDFAVNEWPRAPYQPDQENRHAV